MSGVPVGIVFAGGEFVFRDGDEIMGAFFFAR